MKYIFCFLIILFFSSGFSQEVEDMSTRNKADNLYHIYKIDSINKYYLIYGRKCNVNYKIISKKNRKNSNCSKIQVNHNYNLQLESLSEQEFELEGNTVSLAGNTLVNCFSLDKETTVCKEEDKRIYDLYFVENIKGLCLIE